MSKKKINFIISIILILLSITFTFLVKIVDVNNVGVNGTSIGFSMLNQFVFKKIGVNMLCYYVSDWLGIVPVLMSFIYCLLGFIQLIKKRNIFKVDKELLLLGIFYICLIIIYIFFEKNIVNYRPILIDGFLEASYPSSHTLMAICICGSSIMVNNRLFKNKVFKIINIVSFIIIMVIVLLRFISGVHYFTDIIGGIFISIAMLMTFYSFLYVLK